MSQNEKPLRADSSSANDFDESSLARRMAHAIDESSSDESLSERSVQDVLACLAMLTRAPARTDKSSAAQGTESIAEAGSLKFPIRIGHFEVREMLGHGGFGVVFRALDTTLEREVALKLPRPDSLASSETKRRFVREAKAAAVLDHPGIVPVYDTGELGPLWYIACGLVRGPTLRQWLKDQQRLPDCRVAAKLVCSLAEAAQHAHSRGILHRDLKPSNVLLEPSDETDATVGFQPKLSDFGLAKRLEESGQETIAGTIVGTPQYMAPEQAANRYKEIGVATDVYGLGAILHELLTGEPPFVGESNVEVLKQIQDDDLPPARLRFLSVPRDLETVCLKCLEKEPMRRYQSARDLADDLGRFLDGAPVLARPIGFPAKLMRWYRRRPVVACLASALIVAVTAGTTAALWQWYRAEQYLVEARAAADDAQYNLEQSQHALFDLAWTIEEHNARRAPDDQVSHRFRNKLEEYRLAGWLRPSAPLAIKPLVAVSHSSAARDAAAAGDTQAAIYLYNQALECWCQVTAIKWSHDRTGYDRGFAFCLLGAARHRCRIDAASEDPLRGARELITHVSRDYRMAPVMYDGFVLTTKELAYVQMEARHWREALEHFELARIALEILIDWKPEDRPHFVHRMAAISREIAAMHRKLGNSEVVVTELNRAIAESQEAVREIPGMSQFEHELALDLRALGVFYRERHNLTDAQEMLTRSVSTMNAVFERRKEDPVYAIDLATATREFATVLQANGHKQEALAAFTQSCEAWTDAFSRADSSAANWQMYAKVCHQSGVLALELDRPDRALRSFVDGVAAYSKLSTLGSLKLNEQFELAECHYFLARHSESIGDKQAAIKNYECAVELLKALAPRRHASAAIKDRHRRSTAALAELKKPARLVQPESSADLQ